MPSPLTFPGLKRILSWYCSGRLSSEQSGILPVPQGRVSTKLPQKLRGTLSSYHMQRDLGQETKLNKTPAESLATSCACLRSCTNQVHVLNKAQQIYSSFSAFFKTFYLPIFNKRRELLKTAKQGAENFAVIPATEFYK